MRICAALADAGAEAKRRSFRFGRHRRRLPSRRSALSRCAASDEKKCLFAFTDGSKAPSAASTAAHRHLRRDGWQRGTRRCRPSRNRGVEGCAAAAGLSASAESKTQACAARAPARRPAGRQCAGLCAKAERIGAFFRPSAQRRVPAPPHMECRCAAASPRSRRARTQLALMCGKMRHRLPPLCTEASDCETEASEPIPPKPFSRFGATYRETPRQKAAKRFSLRTKNVCGAQPQTLFVHPFFFASR